MKLTDHEIAYYLSTYIIHDVELAKKLEKQIHSNKSKKAKKT